METVTVILNGFRRPEYLRRQVGAIQSQSVPTNIMYWHNTGEPPDMEVASKLPHTISNTNFGVWARFGYALNARTNYVCVFDDDTIPGKDWLQNCLDTHKKHGGLLGTVGILFQPDYISSTRVGWPNPNTETTQVDIVGHSWFFPRDLLSVFWRELPPLEYNKAIGEDMHFSHMIQKYTKYKTWVPPHPPDNRDLWGSLYGMELGVPNSTASYAFKDMRDLILEHKKKGFKILFDSRPDKK